MLLNPSYYYRADVTPHHIVLESYLGNQPIEFVAYEEEPYHMVYCCSVLDGDFRTMDDACAAFRYQVAQNRFNDYLPRDQFAYMMMADEVFAKYGGGDDLGHKKEVMADIISCADYVLAEVPELVGIINLSDKEQQSVWDSIILCNGLDFEQMKYAELLDGGNCYETAFDNMMDSIDDCDSFEPTLYLCHGICVYEGEMEFTHAWNETLDGEYVMDTSNGNDLFMPRWKYYEIFDVIPESVHRYKYEDGYKEMERTMKWGPWADELQFVSRPKKTAGTGDCFVVAVENLMSDRDLILCHGIVHGQGWLEGMEYPHAWNETEDGYVIDQSNGNDVYMPREAYYALGKIDPQNVRRYDYLDMARQIVDEGTYGPWDPIFDFECREVTAMNNSERKAFMYGFKRGAAKQSGSRRVALQKRTPQLRASMRKRSSDGWDKEICENLLDVLDSCAELAYEVKNCRRGAYCYQAGDTYGSLGAYAYRLGESLMDAGSYLEDRYGDLTADEIDDM